MQVTTETATHHSALMVTLMIFLNTQLYGKMIRKKDCTILKITVLGMKLQLTTSGGIKDLQQCCIMPD